MINFSLCKCERAASAYACEIAKCIRNTRVVLVHHQIVNLCTEHAAHVLVTRNDGKCEQHCLWMQIAKCQNPSRTINFKWKFQSENLIRTKTEQRKFCVNYNIIIITTQLFCVSINGVHIYNEIFVLRKTLRIHSSTWEKERVRSEEIGRGREWLKKYLFSRICTSF